jgi:hypothetical protein
MNRFVLAFGLAAIAGGASAADAVGVPACDDFLAKYEACVSAKIPSAQQPAFRSSIEQMRSAWASAAKDPVAKPALESACTQSSEQAKTSAANFGCSF